MKLFGNSINQEFVQASLIRALKTFAQTALSLITVGAAMEEIAWIHILSISMTAAIYSVLTSLAGGLPETSSNDISTDNDGDVVIQGNVYQISANEDPITWKDKNKVILNIVNLDNQESSTNE